MRNAIEQMTNLPDPPAQEMSAERDCCPTFVALLAIGWLTVPAVQYFGTMQRTQLLVDRKAPFPEFARIDLVGAYCVLLFLSLGYAGWRAISRRRSAQ